MNQAPSTNPSVAAPIASEPNAWTRCKYCGEPGSPLRRVTDTISERSCWNSFECIARQEARDAHMDERWTITAAGLAALADFTPEPTPPTRAPRPRMTPETIEARARQRAHDERVHVFAVAGGVGCYTTKSKSDPSERYSLVAKGGIIGCSCRGFEYRQSCKHVEALKARLARESLVAERAGRQLQAVA